MSNFINRASADKIVDESKAFINNLYSNSSDTCHNCKAVLSRGRELTFNRTDPQEIVDIFLYWCTKELGMSKLTCNTTYTLSTVSHSATQGTDFTNLLMLIEEPLTSLDGDYYCYFKANGACALPPTPEIDLRNWWPQKPSNKTLAKRYAYLARNSSKTFNVAHLSDFHVELLYTLGGEANCSDSMCCTSHSTNAVALNGTINTTPLYNSSYINGIFTKGDEVSPLKSSWQPAHEFGEYTCDTPEVLLNSSLKHVRDTNADKDLNFEFAIFTGDMVDHDTLYYTTIETTAREEIIGFQDMKAWMGDIPVYSVLGNHDTFPYGQLAQASLGFSNRFTWNNELMGKLWEESGWVTHKKVSEHYTGFSIVTRRGLKIISLNSNVWYMKNMYAYAGIASNPDSFGSLRWLIDELIESEELGQRVWIQAHIPFADTDMLPISSNILGKIIARFSPYTIAAIFFGHTHLDEFQLQYAGDKEVENLVNMAWIGQSITPLNSLNPSWRYYEIDANTFSIMGAFHYYQKLNETNNGEGNEPDWQFEYSARESYTNVETAALNQWDEEAPLNATFWHHVAVQIGNNETFGQLFAGHQHRFSPGTPNCSVAGACEDNYCYVTSFTRDEYVLCNSLEK
ncbi:hypothetical protein BABINDRAFT_179815 [Babjeviella inositovora NRRL Y-12698]|uniref:Calcineurin-like phosphoesterase domain-containing protein n=1 Tax=Babjeviella inositovora NRRL Y-12698 TaxID=984486 RepID=A0A1E3QUG4_9ASCO|nr:uncharacterized protein BABINDRAFT_179815 [Babjeviella inositovora NRRL Y-12698]ODQ81325.1 hypothetical protein BABINDRAFT_179815 [Babjeviella inositovora NRRL Y-12698]